MKLKSFALLLAFIMISAPAFSMGSPAPGEPPPEEGRKIKVEGTNYPFSIGIDKPSIKLVTDPGSASSGKITVENNGLKSLKIRIYAADWSYAEDGSKVFHEAGSTKNSCANWIHVNPKSLLLKPLEAEEVEYIITTPKDASGDHVAVIFFESIFGEQEGIVIGGRIGSIIYQETKKQE